MTTTRREFLRNCGFVGATVAGSSLIPTMALADGNKKRKELTMYGPPVGPSVTLATRQKREQSPVWLKT